MASRSRKNLFGTGLLDASALWREAKAVSPPLAVSLPSLTFEYDPSLSVVADAAASGLTDDLAFLAIAPKLGFLPTDRSSTGALVVPVLGARPFTAETGGLASPTDTSDLLDATFWH
ncbi:hypothetical protein [Candidatus Thiosymbion oneisti]|uniref:hypothetical protein n=1 Tax=Candidatus Thiosymbion oneisti TaxID=589554 RepID=UPI00105F2DB8|nr:hypothetical protein [Candidatus Thiosymbion oneisti]